MNEVKGKSGPKTKASQGLERHRKISVTLSPGTYTYLLSRQENGEALSRVADRIISEHSRLTAPDEEMAEMAYRSIV